MALKKLTTLGLLASAFLCCAAPAAASTWPERPITVIVPYSAGGLTDTVTRILSAAVQRELGQTLVVENRPGAGGKIGLELLKRAPADGYTIALAVPGTMITQPLTDPGYGLEPMKDFAPITLAVDTFTVLVTNNGFLPTGGLREFTERVRSQPGRFNYGTPGLGTSFHFNTVLMTQKLGIDVEHVAYKGESAVMSDVASGAIQFALAGTSAQSYVKSNRVRAIAVTSKQRVEAYPEVPTFRELGIDFVTNGWVGYIAPAAVPAPVLDRLNRAFVKAIQDPQVARSLSATGYVPVGTSREAFRSTIDDDSRAYRKLIESGAVRLR
ncbi:MAG: Bug family tripartite tricarboxylate transporter substrate binding protein [Burkholderiaceae bacterium]